MARRNNTQNPNQNQQPQQQPSQASADAENARSRAASEYSRIQGEILETERELAELMQQESRTSGRNATNLQRISELELNRRRSKQELQSIESEISSILDDEENTEKNIVDIIRKRRENQSEIKDLTQSVLTSMREQKHQMMEINDVGKQVTENMSASRGFSEGFGNILEVVNNRLSQGVSFSDQFMDTLQETNRVREDYRNLEREIADNAKAAAEGKYDAKKVEEDLVKKMSKLRSDEEGYEDKVKDFMKNKKDMTEEQIKAKKLELRLEREALNAREVSLNAMSEQNKVLGESSKTAEKTLGVLDKITSGDFKGALLQKFGLDDINSQLKEKVGGALVNVVKSVKAGDLKGAFSEAGKGLKSILDMAGKLTMALGIGALFMLGNFLISSFGKLDKEVSQLGKDFGISKNEAKELHHTAVDVSNEMRVTGIHSEEIAKSLKTVSDNLGGIDLTGAFASGNAQVQQMVKDTALLTEKFGLSAEEAGNLSNIAAISGKSVGEMSMMASTLGKGIFSAKDSMKILAGIPKSIVSQMSKMPEAMIKTAMHAKMLGMNMKQIADIGRKSLDIEQSLEAEMEARVLLGREINLDAMRQAALAGDQEKVMNELLKQVGSMEDFNKMNVLQKEALAKAAGMEVDQMAEMLGKQEELNKAGLSQQQLQELQAKNAGDLAKMAAETGDKDKKAYLEKLAAEKKSEETQAAMADLMKRIQEIAVKLLDPILDMVDGLMNGKDGAEAMDGILNAVKGTVGFIKPIIAAIAATIGYIVKPLTWILGLFGDSKEQTQEIAKTTGKVGDGVQAVTNQVKPLTSGFGSVLTALTAIGGYFFGKSLLVKGMDLLKTKALDFGSAMVSKVAGSFDKVQDKATGVTKTLMGKVSGATKKIGEKIGGSVADKGAEAVSKAPIPGGPGKKGSAFKDFFKKMDPKKMLAGAAALLIVAAALYVAAKAMQEFSTGVKWEGVIMGIVTLGALVGAVMVLGAIMSSGVGAVAIIAGAAALFILSGALYVMGKAMQEFSKAAVILIPFFQEMTKLDMDKLAKLAINIALLGGAFALLGTMMVPIMMGAAAFAVLGASLAVFGVAAMIAGKGIKDITTSIAELLNFDSSKFDGVAKGLGTIGDAILKMGAGSLMSGVGDGISKLFGGGESPLDKVANISQKLNPEKLSATAKAIKDLADSFKYFADETAKLKEFDTDKLDSIIQKMEEVQQAEAAGGMAKAVTGVANAVTGFIGNLFGSPEQQSSQPVSAGTTAISGAGGGGGTTNMANVEKKLDTLISVISQAANQPLVIKFGEKTVEEIKSQLNFKASTDIGVNKGYAKTI
jgi:hypothetical protein